MYIYVDFFMIFPFIQSDKENQPLLECDITPVPPCSFKIDDRVRLHFNINNYIRRESGRLLNF